jgi:hypothetical protein
MRSDLAFMREFEVCCTCYELRGRFGWQLRGVTHIHAQQCRCEREATEREETWRGFDFNQVAELCHACACEVLHSGSRWSVWFCSVCKARVLELRAESGRPVVPIGRHSLMNGNALALTPPPDDAAVDVFADRLISMSERIYRLAEWAHTVVGSNLAAIGRSDDASVPIAEYLDAVRQRDRGEAFDAMLAWMADQPA